MQHNTKFPRTKRLLLHKTVSQTVKTQSFKEMISNTTILASLLASFATHTLKMTDITDFVSHVVYNR